ncbi:hypothetical protein PHSC3_000780 [Chlamydiales bacterium STE3]|nr:hypothetical protein PHSC3_000780 [Chlamydiales bacterium STE3]
MLFNAFFRKPKHSRSYRKASKQPESCAIPEKTGLVLNLILLALLLIAFRIWHLATAEYDKLLEESRKPQRKSIIEVAKRGTIRDRFNIPLAINKIRYQATIIYAPIKTIPSIKTEYDPQGKKILRYKRKEYIARLAELLSRELGLEADRIEDLIHSKASLFYNIPYVIKDEITENEYYRLKMLEKDWLGLHVKRLAKREYPKKKVGSDILGFMGAISKEEYEQIIRELKSLKEFLKNLEETKDVDLPEGFSSLLEVETRYRDLEELAYTVHDYVGKTGVESVFEEQLRGFRGKKSYMLDSKGNILKELPGSRSPLAGKRLLLSISSELQEYAEELLAQNESIRLAKVQGHGKSISNTKQPWIKGGAVVALEPNTGEVLALATWPRFDPNDFILAGDAAIIKAKKGRINGWFENDASISDIWNMFKPYERELFENSSKQFYTEKRWMSWETFLDFILPEKHPLIQWFNTNGTIKNAYTIQTLVEKIEHLTKEPIADTLKADVVPSGELKKTLPLLHVFFKELESNYDKLLLIDLCQLSVAHHKFSQSLVNKVGHHDLGSYRECVATYLSLKENLKETCKNGFHKTCFAFWRKNHEKEFLKEKRLWEKQAKIYPKPYIDYLDEKENELFSQFWKKYAATLCYSALTNTPPSEAILEPFFAYLKLPEENSNLALLQGIIKKLKKEQALEYLGTFRAYHELDRPLKGKYRLLRKGKGAALEKHLASAFYPTYGFGFSRSHAFRQATTQGSLFKIITAFEALSQTYAKNKGETFNQLNPLEMIDKVYKIGNKTYVGTTLEGTPIPQIYKGGRLPRSHLYNLGHMDLIKAFETSSNSYFSLLASDVISDPEDLAKAARAFSYGSKTGIDLPGEIAGKVPDDLSRNQTGLYAMAIGQHTLVVTPLQSALMLASIANGGKIFKPQIIHMLAGHIPNRDESLLNPPSKFQNQTALSILGLDFPLFAPSSQELKRSEVERIQPLVKHEIPFPESIRAILLKSMHKVVSRTQAESLWSLSKLYASHPEAISDYIDLKNQLIGKTSTAESMERIDLDEKEGINLYTHVWFGGIAFENDVNFSFNRPELVVIVYLKFGTFGKEAAPIAAQIVKKWREIKKKKMQQLL